MIQSGKERHFSCLSVRQSSELSCSCYNSHEPRLKILFRDRYNEGWITASSQLFLRLNDVNCSVSRRVLFNFTCCSLEKLQSGFKGSEYFLVSFLSRFLAYWGCNANMYYLKTHSLFQTFYWYRRIKTEHVFLSFTRIRIRWGDCTKPSFLFSKNESWTGLPWAKV